MSHAQSLSFVAALFLAATAAGAAAASTVVSPSTTEESLESWLSQAGTNRGEIQKALRDVSAERREGMVFLVRNMPASDLRSLGAGFLLENVNLAFEAWEAAPWHDRISKELFLNEVLPYASLTEEREAWRKELREKCAPLVAGCMYFGSGIVIPVQWVARKAGARGAPSRASCSRLSRNRACRIPRIRRG